MAKFLHESTCSDLRRPVVARFGQTELRDITDTPAGDGLRLIVSLLSIVWHDLASVTERINDYFSLGDRTGLIRHVHVGNSEISVQLHDVDDLPYLTTQDKKFSKAVLLPAADYAITARRHGLNCREIASDLVQQRLCDIETAWWFAHNMR